MVNISNISKSYRDNKVLKDISIEIKKGAITSIIGPNGSGKSTLLSIISRLLLQDNGVVSLNNKDIRSYKSQDLGQELSILRQFNNINLKLTVQELISFGRFPYTQGKLNKEDENKIKMAIDYLSLEDIKDSYLDELSGGQQQRAFLGMIVAQDTDYILLDEPLNNLDIKYSVQIMRTLRRLVDEMGKTIVIVLHDINFASCYSDYIIALKNGAISNYDLTNNIIKPEVLKSIFDIDFDIEYITGRKICNYFLL